MDEDHPVLMRMDGLLETWKATNDRRFIFLSCYRLMTRNILAAIAAQDFEDPAWVAALMESFVTYYFNALDAYEADPARPPMAWRIAFKAAGTPQTHALQNLVLGVNAHINYDLVFALSGLLAPEWPSLTEGQRQMRYRDHCHVNDIIHSTVDAVQDQVIDVIEPEWKLVDELLGPIDEWMTSLLISQWREEVWEHATHLLDPAFQLERQNMIQHVEQTSLERARDILGKGGPVDLFEFI